jgi:CHAT domain-containing protein
MQSTPKEPGRYLEGSAYDQDQAGLDEAIRRLTGSLEATSDPVVALELGDALAKRYNQHGRLEDLDAAIGKLQRAVSAEQQPQRDYYLGVLGLMFVQRYRQSGNRTDLTAAVRTFSEAVRAAAPRSVRQSEHLGNLGRSLLDRGERTGAVADLRRAVEVLTEARSLPLSGSAEESSILSALGSAYGMLGSWTGNRADLDSAVQMIEAARAARPAGPEEPSLLADLATVLSDRYEQARDASDLDRSIELFDRALKAAFPGTRAHAMWLQGLASALAERAEIGTGQAGATADWLRATEYFRASCASARSGPVDLLLPIARDWLFYSTRRQDWKVAAEAAVPTVEEMRLAILAQGSQESQQKEILAFGNIPAFASFALAKAGRAEEAVIALEQGRARLLAAALDRDRADLALLTAQGHAELAGEYRRLAAEIATEQELDLPLSLIGATNRSSQQQRLRRELEGVRNRIRRVPGYERFQASEAYPDIAAAAEPAPLVYLFVTSFGGMALLVRSAREPPVTIPVPALTSDEVATYVTSYLMAYWSRGTEPDGWSQTVDSVTRWAYDVIAPVLEQLTVSRLVLIPCGLLALLPLHAAWRPGPDQRSGRLYLLDEMIITYAASARSLAEAGRFAAMGEAAAVLVVEDPRPTQMPPLPAAAYEAEATLAWFPKDRQQRLRGEDATRQAVTSALQDAAVWHFACHAITRTNLPLDSGVLLAGDDWFTVENIVKLRRAERSARLAVLSACETAVPGLAAPDEVVGLPTALLQAGVAGVVASMWSVGDRLAALLSAEFYRRWRGEESDPAAALRAAQIWLRDAGLAELHGRHPDLVPAPPRASGAASRLLATAPGPYADPVNWAAFTFWGE